MIIKQCFLTKNNCYRAGVIRKPTGIVVHSTGAANTRLSRYIQPDDGLLGTNLYTNDWNHSGLSVCVNAFIGHDKNGVVQIYQTLPWDMRPWGCGSGSKGSYNNTHVQFEICEDDLKSAVYFKQVYDAALFLCATLCKEYNIPVSSVVDHSEACKLGYGSNHGDITHWFKRYGKTMSQFRADLQAELNKATKQIYRVRETWNDESSQIGAYGVLENAIASCPAGFSVFDSNGKAVYSVAEKVTYTKYKNGYLYEIPFGMIDRIEYVPMSGTRGETVTNAAKRIKWNGRTPDIITNCELFNMSNYKPSTSVVDEGKVHLLTETYGIGFKDHKTPVFSYKNNVKAADFIGAYPTLVRNGKIDFTREPSGLGGNRGRTAFGIKDGCFGFLVIPEQAGTADATLKDLANLFISKGYQNAINVDGGGSTAYQTNEFGYEQGRPVRGFVCVWYKGGIGNKAARNSTGSASNNTASSSTMLQDKTCAGGVSLYASCAVGSVLNVRSNKCLSEKVLTSASVIQKLRRGDKVTWYGYYTSDKKWYYVKCADGTCGYVCPDYLSKTKV